MSEDLTIIATGFLVMIPFIYFLLRRKPEDEQRDQEEWENRHSRFIEKDIHGNWRIK